MFGKNEDELYPSRMRAANPYVTERSLALRNLREDMTPPTDEEYAYAAQANDYRRPSWARGGKILGPLQRSRADGAPPLSRDQRQALAVLRKNQLNQNQTDFWKNKNARAMYEAQRKVKDWRSLQKELARRNRRYIDRKDGQLKFTDEGYLQRETALKNLARYLPGTITKPEYSDDLENLRGDYMTDQAYTDRGFDPTLSGTAWRALDPRLRKDKLAQFAELIGMFNLKPRRDERLTTVASASTVYNTDDYDISFEDLDNNPGTPGMVVITTKNNMVDKRGQTIPAGTIVAVDGWVISPQTQAQQLKRLQTMLFYGQHPTKAARMKVDRRLWNAINFGLPSELKPAKQNFKWLANVIRNHLAAEHKYLPQPQKNAYNETKDTPAILVLGFGFPQAAGTNEVNLFSGGLFRISTPVFNNFLSRVAELIFNMVLAPIMYNTTTGATGSLSDTVLSFRAAYDGTAKYVKPHYGKQSGLMRSLQETNKTENYDSMENNQVNLDAPPSFPSFYYNWNLSYYHPRALGAFFKDEQFRALFEEAVSTFDNHPNADAVIKVAMHTILLETMNSSLPSLIDDVLKRAVQSEADMQRYFGLEPFITLLDLDQINAPNIKANLRKIPPVSAKNWDNEIRGTYDISLRGEAFVPQNKARNEQLRKLTTGDPNDFASFMPAGSGHDPTVPVSFHRNYGARRRADVIQNDTN